MITCSMGWVPENKRKEYTILPSGTPLLPIINVSSRKVVFAFLKRIFLYKSFFFSFLPGYPPAPSSEPGD
jgi:hypothetical protein